jgi:hypothetical protein
MLMDIDIFPPFAHYAIFADFRLSCRLHSRRFRDYAPRRMRAPLFYALPPRRAMMMPRRARRCQCAALRERERDIDTRDFAAREIYGACRMPPRWRAIAAQILRDAAMSAERARHARRNIKTQRARLRDMQRSALPSRAPCFLLLRHFRR